MQSTLYLLAYQRLIPAGIALCANATKNNDNDGNAIHCLRSDYHV